MQHKIAFVGPEVVYKAFVDMEPNWDFQIPLENVEALERELDDDNGNISKDTSVVILFSRLFNNNPDLFSELAAFLAPYSVINILIPPQDRASEESKIRTAIKNKQFELAKEDDSYNANTPFYFVEYGDLILDELYDSISKYVDSPLVPKDTKEAVSKLLDTDNGMGEIEGFEEDSDEEVLNYESTGDGIVITVTSSKGGSGKSTDSTGIGDFLSESGQKAFEQGLVDHAPKIITVDLDVKDGQLGYLNNATSPNIVNVYIARKDNTEKLTEEHIKQGIYHNPKSNTDFLFAPKTPKNAEAISPAFYLEVIKVLKTMYDYVILDTSVNYLDPLFSEVAYPMSDKIVLVSDMGISSLQGMGRWIKEFVYSPLREKTIDEDKVGIIINKFIPNTGIGLKEIERASHGIKILGFIPNMPQFITTKANHHSLNEIIYNEGIKSSFKMIVSQLLPEQPLGDF